MIYRGWKIELFGDKVNYCVFDKDGFWVATVATQEEGKSIVDTLEKMWEVWSKLAGR